MGLFRRDKDGRDGGSQAMQSRRASRGWVETCAFLKEREGMRVLDFGATSSSNINYLTQLGHSVYMANVVEDAARPEWMVDRGEGKPGEKTFDHERFAQSCYGFSEKMFDAVLLWDTADYLPPTAVPALFTRLQAILNRQGRLLAFFHGKKDTEGPSFSRFHISDEPEIMVQPVGTHSVQQCYQTRQIERFLEGYADVRFLLGKDNMREVFATR